MDEYVNLPEDHPESYHSFMWTNLFSHVDIKKENVNIGAVDFGLKTTIFGRLGKNLHRWGVWRPFNKWTDQELSDKKKQTQVWRMDKTMGYGQDNRQSFSYAEYGSDHLNKNHQILVINDNGLGYRHRLAEASWPSMIREVSPDGPDWIFLKMLMKKKPRFDLVEHFYHQVTLCAKSLARNEQR